MFPQLKKYLFWFSQARENIFVFPSKIKSLILFPQVNKFLIFDSASNNIFTCGNKTKDYFSLAETKKDISKAKKNLFSQAEKNLLFCSPSKKIYGSVERTLRKKINDNMINDDNSFNTRSPGRGGGHDNQLMYGPPWPGGGVTLSFCFGIFNDKILEFVASFHQITILDILSPNRITYALDVFPYISCEQNVKVEGKLIYFLRPIGFV